MIYTVCRYFFTFMIFGVGGWIVETLLYMIRDGKVVKRGFLFGPICPIYGVAAILCRYLFYGTVDTIWMLFILGFLMTGLLEYITHFTMEKVFHAMWWDYSDRKFNIHGRVYLKGLLIFGAGVVVIVKYILPLIERLMDFMSPTVLYIICFILYSIIIIDVATTLVDLKGIVKALKTLQATAIGETQKKIDLTAEQMEKVVDFLKNSDIYLKFRENFFGKGSVLEHFKRRYPNFTLKKYKYIIDYISDAPSGEHKKKDVKLYGTADSIPDPEDEEVAEKPQEPAQEPVVEQEEKPAESTETEDKKTKNKKRKKR
ncbi:MAG: putative ABC transporter permease [Clostridia bacterium]|nr:putative ABC transporter permease [Clostridia bacterium]